MLISCSKYDDNADSQYNDVKETSVPNVQTSIFNDRLLTDQEITQIGIDHNNYLANLLSGAKNIDDAKNNFNTILNNSGKIINTEDENNYINSTNAMNTNNLNVFISTNKDYFNDYEDLVNKLTQLNEANSEEGMLVVEKEARRTLKGIDLDMFLVNSSVSRASLRFWTEHSPNVTVEALTRWQHADGISAAIGFVVLACVTSAIAVFAGTGGLAIPAVAVVAEIAGIGLGSAMASAATYFRI